jgi:hypothetical protein
MNFLNVSGNNVFASASADLLSEANPTWRDNEEDFTKIVKTLMEQADEEGVKPLSQMLGSALSNPKLILMKDIKSLNYYLESRFRS